MEKTGGTNQKLILVAMIFAVSMTFIDQTIVAIAVPQLQQDLSLSSTGVQWIINGYLLGFALIFTDISLVLINVIGALVFALLVPYIAIGRTLLYFDLQAEAEKEPVKRWRERLARRAATAEA